MTWPVTSQSKQHADGGQVLLDGGGASRALVSCLDVGGDVHRLDGAEGQAVPLAPGEEIADGPGVGLRGCWRCGWWR